MCFEMLLVRAVEWVVVDYRAVPGWECLCMGAGRGEAFVDAVVRNDC